MNASLSWLSEGERETGRERVRWSERVKERQRVGKGQQLSPVGGEREKEKGWVTGVCYARDSYFNTFM